MYRKNKLTQNIMRACRPPAKSVTQELDIEEKQNSIQFKITFKTNLEAFPPP